MSSETDSKNTGGSPSNSDPTAMRDELITYLSSEIQTHSQYLLTFRSRISFTVLVGPFLILGSFLVAAKPTARNYWGTTQVAFGAGAAALYLILGFYGSTIDQHGNDRTRSALTAIVNRKKQECPQHDKPFLSIDENHNKMNVALANLLVDSSADTVISETAAVIKLCIK